MKLCVWNDCCDKHRNAVLTLKRIVDLGHIRKLSGSEYAACIIALNKLEESFSNARPKFCIKRIVKWFRRLE